MRDLPEILKVERYRGKDAVYDSTVHVKHFLTYFRKSQFTDTGQC